MKCIQAFREAGIKYPLTELHFQSDPPHIQFHDFGQSRLARLIIYYTPKKYIEVPNSMIFYVLIQQYWGSSGIFSDLAVHLGIPNFCLVVPFFQLTAFNSRIPEGRLNSWSVRRYHGVVVPCQFPLLPARCCCCCCCFKHVYTLNIGTVLSGRLDNLAFELHCGFVCSPFGFHYAGCFFLQTM